MILKEQHLWPQQSQKMVAKTTVSSISIDKTKNKYPVADTLQRSYQHILEIELSLPSTIF